MSETISGYHNTLQILNAGTSSVTIAGTIKANGTLPGSPQVGFGAVYGAVGGITVTNFGLVDDTHATTSAQRSAGIILAGQGSINNHGTILSTAGYGAYLHDGGNVTNSGTITAKRDGIVLNPVTIAGTADFVSNSGVIDATGKPFTRIGGDSVTAYGVSIYGAATVQNTGSGIIESQYGMGIYLRAQNFQAGKFGTLAGAVTNAGTIKGVTGIEFLAKGSLGNSGEISASSVGELVLAASTIINSGIISAGNAGILAGSAVAISGNASSPAAIFNSGTIASSGSTTFSVLTEIYGSPSLYDAGIIMQEGGQLSNSSSGVISGLIGVRLESTAGLVNSINNAGKIIAADYGVHINNTSTLAGSVPVTLTNSGLIEATARHIAIYGGTFGAVGVVITSGGEIINQAGGSIIGYNGVAAFDAIATVDNLGFIGGEGTYSAIYMNAGGAVTNSGSIITTAAADKKFDSENGIDIHGTASVTNANSGLISGSDGVYLLNGGYVNNSGSILGSVQGFVAYESATLNNTGLIMGGAETYAANANTWLAGGVELNQGGKITNSGSILGSGAGIIAYAAAAISNSGAITATGTALAIAKNSIVGTLSLEPAGIALLKGGTISNASSGIVSSAVGYGIDLKLGGSLSNAGKISGKAAGVLAQGAAVISNSGTVSESGTIWVSNGQTLGAAAILLTAGGTISNTGSIIGAGEGILIETTSAAAGVLNSGLIKATGTTFKINGALEGSAGVFLVDGGTLTNQAGGTIIGYGAGVLSFFDLGTGDKTRNSTIATSIVNSGLIEATAGAITFTSGTVISAAGGVVLNGGGTLINEATGTISGHFGVYLNGGSSKIANGVDNLGTITGVSDFGILLGQNASLNNAGHITGAIYGVVLDAANQVTNSGTIIGTHDGILAPYTTGTASTVSNSGLIEATGTANFTAGTFTLAPVGVNLDDGGALTNASTGTIFGGGVGVDLSSTLGNASSIFNSGLIEGSGTTFVNGTATYGSSGIGAFDGGWISNATTGTISAVEAGIFADPNALNAALTVINSGLIKTTGGPINSDGTLIQPAGVALKNGGTLINQSTGKITAYDGAYITGPASIHSFIDNLGTVTGTGEWGIILEESASLTNSGHVSGATYGLLLGGTNLVNNLAGGSISGSHAGILANNNLTLAATIDNAGIISGADGTFISGSQAYDDWGAELIAGGTFANAATGTVSAYAGIIGEADSTIINAGTITGLSGPAVQLLGSGDKVVEDPGAVFHGLVSDGSGTGILELASGSTAGTIAFNSQFSGFATVNVDTGANWDLAGSTIATLLNNGALTLTAGASVDISSAVNAGSTGVFLLSGKASLEIAALLGTNVKIEFLAATPSSTLIIDNAAQFGSNVGKSNYAGPLLEDFKAGDVIDLKNIAATGLKLNYNATTGDLQITNSSGGVIATLQFQTSSLGSGSFKTATDNAHGTLLTLT